MNDRWEVFDHEVCSVVATFWREPDAEVIETLESLGYWVRPHEYNKVNQQDAYFG